MELCFQAVASDAKHYRKTPYFELQKKRTKGTARLGRLYSAFFPPFGVGVIREVKQPSLNPLPRMIKRNELTCAPRCGAARWRDVSADFDARKDRSSLSLLLSSPVLFFHRPRYPGSVYNRHVNDSPTCAVFMAPRTHIHHPRR